MSFTDRYADESCSQYWIMSRLPGSFAMLSSPISLFRVIMTMTTVFRVCPVGRPAAGQNHTGTLLPLLPKL